MILVTTRSIPRFVLLTIALAITLALGYLRFVRRGKTVVLPSDVDGLPSGTTAVADLAVRVDALEQRLEAVGRALTTQSPPSAS